MENFYTLLSNTGINAIIAARASNSEVKLTKIAVGDGDIIPSQDMTALKSEKHRFNINSIIQDIDNPNYLIVEGVIPSNVGGFYVSEVAIYTDQNTLFAIGSLPKTYKPLLEEGSAKDLTIKIFLEVTNADSVTLKVDDSVVLATRKFVLSELKKYALINGDETKRFKVADAVELNEAINKKQFDNTAVKLTGNQTIAGVKTFSSNIVGNITGNSATATKLATARLINGVAFDGGANITIVDSTKAPLNSPTFTGNIVTNGYITIGQGSGSVALTVNDGGGNANVTFNHAGGIPDSNGSSARITSNVDSSPASMIFSLYDNVTAGTSPSDGYTPLSLTTSGAILAGVPTAPTAPVNTNSAQIATTAFVQANVDNTAVKLTGNQTVAGIKTFSSSPIVPTPTTNTQAANKAYVDSATGGWSANDIRAKTALNASGAAPIYGCRAWVNFNGTGTVAIRASGNVSSITDNGVGDYTVNFTTAMPDANYSMSGGTQAMGIGGSSEVVSFKDGIAILAGSSRILTHRTGVGNIDTTYATVTYFR